VSHSTSIADRVAIERVHRLIAPYIRRTPVVDVDGSDFGLNPFPVALKLEQLQHAGSFKTRGAFANLLTRPIPPVGVAAASGGNHGAAVAYAAMRLGIEAHIFVPTVSSPAKVARIRSYGATLTIAGDRYADALAVCDQWIARTSAASIHAFDQRETLLGQGTLGLEYALQRPEVDTVFAAVGGGGLIAGIAAWYAGRVRVIGVEPEGSPTLTAALRAGRPVDASTEGIAADSLAPRRVGDLVLPIAQRFVDRVILVSDDEIRCAQQALWDRVRIVAEPGGAAAFAALSSRRYLPTPDERIGVIVSGGNTTSVNFA
jgi:threonine dehydratase